MGTFKHLSIRFKFAIIDKKADSPNVFLHIYVSGYKHAHMSTKIKVSRKAWDYKSNQKKSPKSDISEQLVGLMYVIWRK